MLFPSQVVVVFNYRPQTKFAKVMFLQVSVILSTGGGHTWLLWGGMHGCSGGACMVAPGGHAWLLPGGGMHGCSQRGACMVAPGGGHVWLLPGGWGHAWLLWGGMCGCSGGVHGCS